MDEGKSLNIRTNKIQEYMDQLQYVPADAVIANNTLKRKEEQPYLMWWKARRNAKIALKARLKDGPDALVLMNPKTMSVVTDRQVEYDIARL